MREEGWRAAGLRWVSYLTPCSSGTFVVSVKSQRVARDPDVPLLNRTASAPVSHYH